MVALTSSQKDIKDRITKNVEHEIGMCDSYSDLLILATALWDSAKKIFSSYAKDYGEDALERIISIRK